MDAKSDSVVEPKIQFLRQLEELGAIAQNGLTYGKDKYDIERFEKLRDITAEMIALVSHLPSGEARAWLQMGEHYATPKIDTRAVILRGEEVLLVQEKSDGKWTLPGGWCDINESAKEGVEKEVREESGLIVEATRLLALFDKRMHDHPVEYPHSYKTFFLCEERGGELLPETLETSGTAFVHWQELPVLSVNRVTKQQIETLVAVALDPTHPTLFD